MSEKFPSFNCLCIGSLLAACYVLATVSYQVGQTCDENTGCGGGLLCQNCSANRNVQSRCTQYQPTIPTSKVQGLPFNRYSWLTTHNSFAITGWKSPLGVSIIAPTNQEDSIADQLKNGVRGLMLDMYDFCDDIWLCHSIGGVCYNWSAFQPASNALKDVRAFLEANPSEVITIFIEDYVTSSQGLTNLFDISGLREYWFPLNRMPQTGQEWPSVDDMIKENQRLVVFTSNQKKEAQEGIAYQWRYAVENHYGDQGMKAGTCHKREESYLMNSEERSLIVQNYFPDYPNITGACADNSGALTAMIHTCYASAGRRWPNFLAVDFYMRNDGVGSAGAADAINGRLICGCNSITSCKPNMTYGSCEDFDAVPPSAPFMPRAGPGVPSQHSGELFFSGVPPLKLGLLHYFQIAVFAYFFKSFMTFFFKVDLN